MTAAIALLKNEALLAQTSIVATATEILRDVMQFRRAVHAHANCLAASPCAACLAPHLPKIITAIEARLPITFVLPAFPGKSPNPHKVLGHLPDMAERQALQFLGELCERVKRVHAPGAQVILCSDGRVFSDVVGMNEEHVTAYQSEISQMIGELDLTEVIHTFDLDDLFSGRSFAGMRDSLMERHGASLESLQEKVRRGGKEGADKESEDAHRMYCGITRFLVEDSIRPGQALSKTAIQKDCRVRAYEVIRRSNAWSGLVENQFPQAVRLSIHPQTCGSKKLGIRLVNADSWMTPWHGVAMEVDGRFVLIKKFQAEALGAQLVQVDGRPSHYRHRGAGNA